MRRVRGGACARDGGAGGACVQTWAGLRGACGQLSTPPARHEAALPCHRRIMPPLSCHRRRHCRHRCYCHPPALRRARWPCPCGRWPASPPPTAGSAPAAPGAASCAPGGPGSRTREAHAAAARRCARVRARRHQPGCGVLLRRRRWDLLGLSGTFWDYLRPPRGPPGAATGRFLPARLHAATGACILRQALCSHAPLGH